MAKRRLIAVESLTSASFASFGTVIQNPANQPASSQTASQTASQIKAVIANQGTATKYADICAIENHYHLASSRTEGRLAMSMFVCTPRQLRQASSEEGRPESGQDVFDVDILERHPYTTQTFVPMGLASQDLSTSYLVIVAPTKQVTSKRAEILERPKPYSSPDTNEKTAKKSKLTDTYSRARPRPYNNDKAPPKQVDNTAPSAPWSTNHSMKKVIGQTAAKDLRRHKPNGSGPPDLTGLKAFIANGNQAVTYGAGTWHAPMVVLGQQPIDFVVLQYVNGVSNDDCQEMELVSNHKDDLIGVAVAGLRHASGSTPSQIRSRI